MSINTVTGVEEDYPLGDTWNYNDWVKIINDHHQAPVDSIGASLPSTAGLPNGYAHYNTSDGCYYVNYSGVFRNLCSLEAGRFNWNVMVGRGGLFGRAFIKSDNGYNGYNELADNASINTINASINTINASINTINASINASINTINASINTINASINTINNKAIYSSNSASQSIAKPIGSGILQGSNININTGNQYVYINTAPFYVIVPKYGVYQYQLDARFNFVGAGDKDIGVSLYSGGNGLKYQGVTGQYYCNILISGTVILGAGATMYAIKTVDSDVANTKQGDSSFSLNLIKEL
jgi:hypothetical protein